MGRLNSVPYCSLFGQTARWLLVWQRTGFNKVMLSNLNLPYNVVYLGAYPPGHRYGCHSAIITGRLTCQLAFARVFLL